jgi:acyl carrier protein
MSDIERHIFPIVANIIADELGVPAENVKPETALSLGDIGWKGFLSLGLEIELAFGIAFPIEVPNSWTCVADVIAAVERALVPLQRGAAA